MRDEGVLHLVVRLPGIGDMQIPAG
jgi:hypothetical protein